MTNVQLQERDRHLLNAVKKLGYLTREQASVIGPFGSRSRANARLLSLVRSGFLKRVLIPSGFTRRTLYTPKDLKRLTPRAVMFLEHGLAVNDAVIAAVFQASGGASVSEWQKEVEIDGIPGLIPDATLRVSKADGTSYLLCLEVDRGSEAGSKWSAKVENYQAGAAAWALQTPKPPLLRCAVVCLSQRRLEGLRAQTADVTAKGFRFTTLQAIQVSGFWSATWYKVEGEGRSTVI